MIRWGELRMTQDADLTVFTGFRNDEMVIDAFLSEYRSRSENAREFAFQRRVMLLLTADSIPFDVSLGGLPFEERMMQRSSEFHFFPEVSLRTCSAEDLLTLKAFSSRAIDWMDVEGVIARYGESIDWDTVFGELDPLLELKEEPEIRTRLQQLRRKQLN